MKKIFFYCLSITTTFLFAQEITLEDSLIAHYKFEDNLRDTTDNEFHAEGNLESFITGITNKAGEFNGTSNYVNTDYSFDFENRTVSVWFNAEALDGTGATERVILDMNDMGLTYGMLKVKIEDGVLKLMAGGESSFFEYPYIQKNTWYNVVLTRDAQTVQYFINGIYLGESVSGSVGSTFEPNPNLIIGAGRSTNKQFFDGIIDEVRIYNRVLSVSEIAQLANYNSFANTSNDCATNDTLNINILLADQNNQLVESTLKVYPNPASDQIVVEITNLDVSFPIEIALYNALGQEITREVLNGNSITMDISTVTEAGVYFLKVFNDNNLLGEPKPLIIK